MHMVFIVVLWYLVVAKYYFLLKGTPKFAAKQMIVLLVLRCDDYHGNTGLWDSGSHMIVWSHRNVTNSILSLRSMYCFLRAPTFRINLFNNEHFDFTVNISMCDFTVLEVWHSWIDMKRMLGFTYRHQMAGYQKWFSGKIVLQRKSGYRIPQHVRFMCRRSIVLCGLCSCSVLKLIRAMYTMSGAQNCCVHHQYHKW